MSLQKFAHIFQLEITKGLFPYELFKNIDELRLGINCLAGYRLYETVFYCNLMLI